MSATGFLIAGLGIGVGHDLGDGSPGDESPPGSRVGPARVLRARTLQEVPQLELLLGGQRRVQLDRPAADCNDIPHGHNNLDLFSGHLQWKHQLTLYGRQ
jgi:hypothetical protein